MVYCWNSRAGGVSELAGSMEQRAERKIVGSKK